MRKIVILVVSAVLCFNYVDAQQNLRFIVFANPCINWLSSDVRTVKYSSVTIGYYAGLAVDKFFAERYAISTGISIGSMGGSLVYRDTTKFIVHGSSKRVPAGQQVKFSLQYINIPLGLKFKTNQIGYFTYFANLGVAMHININSSATSSDTKNTLDDDNISENISLFNLSYFFGGGAEYSLGGNTSLIFGLGFDRGFIDMTSQESDKITSRSLIFKLGVLF